MGAGLPERQRIALAAVQRPLSPSCITAPAPRPAWKDRPSWFLIAEDDRMIAADTQRFVATRMNATIRAVNADHLPMVTDPDSVTEILLKASDRSP